MKDNTKRFSDRVEDYIKYRPNYPGNLTPFLKENIGLNESKIIADIGSGTGISSIPFLKNNNKVFGVEPNKEMREAAEKLLSVYPNFESVGGSSEKTNLPGNSVDILFAGQAFHWFDKTKSKTEFERILKKNGNIVLVWNSRSVHSEFQQEYEKVLYETIEEYKLVNHRNISGEEITQFFNPKKVNKATLENQQILDLNGLKGRLLSSSYCPKSGPVYTKLMERIALLFNKYEKNDQIVFEYETQVYYG